MLSSSSVSVCNIALMAVVLAIWVRLRVRRKREMAAVKQRGTKESVLRTESGRHLKNTSAHVATDTADAAGVYRA